MPGPARVTAFVSLKVMLFRVMSAPALTVAVATLLPKMTLAEGPPGTTPPAVLPEASSAQLLDVPLESAMKYVAPVSWLRFQ